MKTKRILINLFALFAVAAFHGVATSAQAATISFYTASSFDNATTDAVLGDFTSVPTTTGTGPYYSGYNPLVGYSSLQGVSIMTPNAGGVVNVNSAGFYGAQDLQVPYAVNSVYTGTAPDIFTITLPHPETAFSLDFDSLFNSTTATVSLSNGFSTQVVTPSTEGVTEFLGFTSTTPFNTVTLSVPTQQSIVIADFTQAKALATPLPTGWIMMLTALLGLGFSTWRSRRATVKAS